MGPGRSVGREADFSTALLTKGVSSFGRNDKLSGGLEKTKSGMTAAA
jgi:hypothetical protein